MEDDCAFNREARADVCRLAGFREFSYGSDDGRRVRRRGGDERKEKHQREIAEQVHENEDGISEEDSSAAETTPLHL